MPLKILNLSVWCDNKNRVGVKQYSKHIHSPYHIPDCSQSYVWQRVNTKSVVERWWMKKIKYLTFQFRNQQFAKWRERACYTSWTYENNLALFAFFSLFKMCMVYSYISAWLKRQTTHSIHSARQGCIRMLEKKNGFK